MWSSVSGYDIVLLTNFLHHFDVATCEALLRKVHAALAPGGRAVTLEFVPNEDRDQSSDSRKVQHGDAWLDAERRRVYACGVSENVSQCGFQDMRDSHSADWRTGAGGGKIALVFSSGCGLAYRARRERQQAPHRASPVS